MTEQRTPAEGLAPFRALIDAIEQRPDGTWIVGGDDPEMTCCNAAEALRTPATGQDAGEGLDDIPRRPCNRPRCKAALSRRSDPPEAIATVREPVQSKPFVIEDDPPEAVAGERRSIIEQARLDAAVVASWPAEQREALQRELSAVFHNPGITFPTPGDAPAGASGPMAELADELHHMLRRYRQENSTTADAFALRSHMVAHADLIIEALILAALNGGSHADQ